MRETVSFLGRSVLLVVNQLVSQLTTFIIIKFITHATPTPEDMFPKFITLELGDEGISQVKFAETNFGKIRLTASH